METSHHCGCALSMGNLVQGHHSSLMSQFPSVLRFSVLLKSTGFGTSTHQKRIRSLNAAIRCQSLIHLKPTYAQNVAHQEVQTHEGTDTAILPLTKYVEPQRGFFDEMPHGASEGVFTSALRHANLIYINNYVRGVLEFARERLLTAFVDMFYQFSEQPFVSHCQRNFSPVDEIGERVPVELIQGAIPRDFPKGTYIRNGPNPRFGAALSCASPFGKTASSWFEGDGMLHALYFEEGGNVFYKNKYVESRTWKIEKERGKPVFIPAFEGESRAVLAAYLLNQLRFGIANRAMSNTNVFQHGGRMYAIAENDVPHQIEVSDLSTLSLLDCSGKWGRPFTSHPKIVQQTGEMVVIGVAPTKPYCVLGIISADSKTLLHKTDLKLDRCSLAHEVAITERYNIILDFPLTIDVRRLAQGGQLMSFENGSYARMGVMPRYGDADSVKWFDVKTHCTFHVVNSFDDGDEVVVYGCRASGSILTSLKTGEDKLQWFARAFKQTNSEEAKDPSVDGVLFTRLYEWRLNMKDGTVKERFLTGTEFSMDMPRINENLVGLHNKFAYAQVVDIEASCEAGLPKYGKYVKMHLTENGVKDEPVKECTSIKVEFHELGPNRFGSEPMFVARPFGTEEDDGWIVAYVHDETTDASEVYIFDARKISDAAIARIHLPQRVPYGFHGTFVHTAHEILP